MGLESNALRESRFHVLRGIIAQGVWKAELHVLDHAQGILRTHLLHRLWRRPNRHATSDNVRDVLVEFLLIPALRSDLAGIDANDASVELFHARHECIVLCWLVGQQLSIDALFDEPIENAGGVEAKTGSSSDDLVLATILLTLDIGPHNANVVLGVCWRRIQHTGLSKLSLRRALEGQTRSIDWSLATALRSRSSRWRRNRAPRQNVETGRARRTGVKRRDDLL